MEKWKTRNDYQIKGKYFCTWHWNPSFHRLKLITMTDQDVAQNYDVLMDVLDRFFHRKLRKAKLYDQLQYQKKELKQKTFLAVLLKIKKEGYNDYSLSKLAIIKANDTWIEFCRSHFKNPEVYKPTDELEQEHIPVDSGIEVTIDLKDAQKDIDIVLFQMLKLHTEGYSYKEIAKEFNTTEGAVKMRILRHRNDSKP